MWVVAGLAAPERVLAGGTRVAAGRGRALARRASPGPSRPRGWVRGVGRRSPRPWANDLRPLAPAAESLAGRPRAAGAIRRKRPALLLYCDTNPGRYRGSPRRDPNDLRQAPCRRTHQPPGRPRRVWAPPGRRLPPAAQPDAAGAGSGPAEQAPNRRPAVPMAATGRDPAAVPSPRSTLRRRRPKEVEPSYNSRTPHQLAAESVVTHPRARGTEPSGHGPPLPSRGLVREPRREGLRGPSPSAGVCGAG
jgi:hypothetical protein